MKMKKDLGETIEDNNTINEQSLFFMNFVKKECFYKIKKESNNQIGLSNKISIFLLYSF